VTIPCSDDMGSAARDHVRWRHPDHSRFAADMERVGLRVRHYRGRFFWQGPAVIVTDRDQAISATQVACQWDQMGLDWIVYPQAYATERPAGRELEGRTIRLVRCEDPHTQLRSGLTGVVTLGAGTVLWEDGQRLGLIPGVDAWELADA
jgi:hypothetical protein